MLILRTLILTSALLLAHGCVPQRPHANITGSPDIAAIERRIGGRLGVSLISSDGAVITSHRGDERFAMCSTFKVALASLLFAAHERGAVDMFAPFALTEGDLVPHAPFVEERLATGTLVSLHELAQAAVEVGDNAATNLVLEAVGGPAAFTAFVRSHGDAVTRLDRMEPELNRSVPGDPRDTTSPLAMGQLMQELLIRDARSEAGKLTLQQWMRDSTTGYSRIRAGLPTGWPVGDKTGSGPRGSAYNDVAIIWPSVAGAGVPPVVLAVYVERPTAQPTEVEAAIADVARLAARLIVLPGERGVAEPSPVASRSIRFPRYLGQRPPGKVPEVFAPGLISKPDQHEFGSVFDRDGREFFYAVDLGERAEIRRVSMNANGKPTTQIAVSHARYSYNDPFLSPDGNELFFISNQPLGGRGFVKDYDIWHSRRSGDGWSAPINAGPSINSRRDEYYVSFSDDGSLYFASNVSAEPGNEDDFDLFRSIRTEGVFQQPSRLSAAVNSKQYEADVFVAPDASYLIFSARRAGGLGKGDLYISFDDGGAGWTKAKNMGSSINTAGHELCPYVTGDGRYLFYTSNQDIYWVDAAVLSTYR